MNRSILTSVALAGLALLLPALQVSGATVNYSGTLYDKFGVPIIGGRVIAGTFKPGFDATFTNYSCTYGDNVCNLDPDNYGQAVADGNFIPLNSGVLTGPFGAFSGSGISTAVGSKIWIYGFTGSQPICFDTQLLASSTSSSYVVPPSGTMTVVASAANEFIYGKAFGNGVSTGTVPIPEPSSPAFAALGIAIASMRRTRRRSVARR